MKKFHQNSHLAMEEYDQLHDTQTPRCLQLQDLYETSFTNANGS
jgi:hypothetical protein